MFVSYQLQGDHVLQIELCPNISWEAESSGILVHDRSIKSSEGSDTNESCRRGTRIYARAAHASVR